MRSGIVIRLTAGCYVTVGYYVTAGCYVTGLVAERHDKA